MSAASPATTSRVTVPDFVKAKSQGRKLAVVTAYDFLWAGLMDAAGVDAVLVGDSLGMVVQGKETTLPVTLDEMIYHGELVARATKRALVIVDLPFMTYQVSPRQALKSAGRVFKETGAGAVKLEGGVNQSRAIEALAAADLPVMAHVGMRPQSVRRIGRMSAIQRNEDQLVADARAAEAAGAFSIVLELIPRGIAKRISAEVKIPTIGIGAGPECDGQVLVTPDMLGLTEGFSPRFLKRYANLAETVRTAVGQYVQEVRSGEFPTAANSHE
ncbi:3-methyl-2-oxobutanoate hydroxymethyltransferase [Caulifigura coniformis]|uniref:3-methyl-2-oxobutanoate hydroxymethyltransferase n=1 Tax=Caulifigura coniformis TaxID=2527983 RepID=A0A517SBS2_9PLAN|nr:3-methyl-2-oxobutanoate hydroxymethyltransferase [Caulifigura coniformis]QDT53565.1 3-methyl-2-oxobutanoate hydroxymethyltransferase [Caulifigura coniformis]